ncbi:CHRD domain-containing protein [Pedobacter heparinus]|uniref:CHRD domain-containing protein n=1 Tax=Pedobacter heparinus TaxID=984 RepID=UPI0029300C5F|nr:CHRD domain-containing protein [Pedobacter heparinus]
MGKNIIRGLTSGIIAVCVLFCGLGCKKVDGIADTKIKPPIRTYIVTARIDKKGTNSNSEGTAVLKGTYDEGTKALSYTLEYKNLEPLLITLRSGAKGSVGALISEIYKKSDAKAGTSPIKGGFTLNPLQERYLLKGQWFVAIATLTLNPEISGILTLKQK